MILESVVPQNHKCKHFLGNCCRVVYYAAILCTLQSKHSKSFPKKTCSEKVSYIFSKKPLIFWKRKSQKNPYISGNRTFLNFPKRNFFIFWQKYIQNPSIFRTRSIFRTLVYSEHCQTTTINYNNYVPFCKNSYLGHSLSLSLKNKKSSYIFRKCKFLALTLRKCLYFLKRKLFLYFGERKLQKIP